MFGIGICANAALGKILTVETRSKGNNKGIRVVVDFDHVNNYFLGDYSAEKWEELDFSGREYNTLIRIENLLWEDINDEDVSKFLIEKHWPILIDKDINITLSVNGKKLEAAEPKDAIKYEFSSDREFKINGKYVPKVELDCGIARGIFYLRESGFGEEASIDVYVKNQRIDSYSGAEVDWLRIKDLRSPQGFKVKLKGIIKVEAEDEQDYSKRSPLNRNILRLKSDRSGFFEESKAFRHLCAYLNEKSNGKELSLPYGGLLRLINSEWYKNLGADVLKTQELIQNLEPDLKNDLSKIFEDEKLQTKPLKELGELEKESRLKPKDNATSTSENVMFRCPKCQDILRVKIPIYKEWQKGNTSKKSELQKKYWVCLTCSYILDPIKDKYLRGPIGGEEIMQIKLMDGSIAHLLAEPMGKEGIKSVYLPEDSAIKINAEHAMLVYSLKTSPEAFKCNLLDSIIYSIAIERSKGRSVNEFQSIYNNLSSKISRVIDVSEYEEALNQLRIDKTQ